jgi:hypothetical protein
MVSGSQSDMTVWGGAHFSPLLSFPNDYAEPSRAPKFREGCPSLKEKWDLCVYFLLKKLTWSQPAWVWCLDLPVLSWWLSSITSLCLHFLLGKWGRDNTYLGGSWWLADVSMGLRPVLVLWMLRTLTSSSTERPTEVTTDLGRQMGLWLAARLFPHLMWGCHA